MLVTVINEPDRREPLPSLVELPAHLVRRLSRRGRRLLAIGGALMLVAIVVLVAVVVPHNRTRAADRDAQQRQRAASDADAFRGRGRCARSTAVGRTKRARTAAGNGRHT
jgi:type II secretory pathway component PulM